MSSMRTKPAQQKSPAEIYGGPDRRQSVRNPHHVPATLQPADGNAEIDEPALVCNLSLGGVGLVCDHRYRPNTVFRITLGNGPLFLNAKIKVVSCRARPDGRYDVGCQFC
jgi:hypothetical protein